MGVKSGAIIKGSIVSVLLLTGCAAKKSPPWIPPPRVHWQHLSTTPLTTVYDGYVILEERPSTGRFPAALAVTKINVTRDYNDDGSELAFIAPKPKNEFLMWNSVFEKHMAVSEVFPIAHRNLGGGPANSDRITDAFRALDARIGLIYGTNRLDKDHTEMIGVLYDIPSAKPIASIHAQARSSYPSASDKGTNVDLWATDSRARARERFQTNVCACMRELIARDTPHSMDVPSGGIPAGPVRTVSWPPHRVPFDH